MKNLVIASLIASIASVPSAFADGKDYLFQRAQAMRNRSQVVELARRGLMQAPTVESGTYDQKLDHFTATDTRTFKQRWFLNSAFATGDTAPVIYLMCGEGTCDENYFFGPVMNQAKKLGAHVIELEHRYYGKSQPFADLSTENLKYLSIEQALEDLADFQRYAAKTMNLKGKWVAVGGSYSGTLSAYYRLKHPELVEGALASSAPVRAKVDFEEYDHHVAGVVGPQCLAAIKSVVQTIESKLRTTTELEKIKAVFGAQDVRDPQDFMYIVADMAASAVQYGMKDQFCQAVMGATDPVGAYAEAGKEAFSVLNIAPFQDSFQFAEDTNPETYLKTGFGSRQWLYQSCTEFGFFQVAYHDAAGSARSPVIDLALHERVCKQLFGLGLPNTDQMNKDYYEKILAAPTSHIFFTNGSDDPWSNLSISEKLGNNKNPDLDYMIIQGAAHCEDLTNGFSEEPVKAANRFGDLASMWLK